MLKTNNLFASKGKGKATYYVAGVGLNTEADISFTNVEFVDQGVDNNLNTQPLEISTQLLEISTQPLEISAQPLNLSTQPVNEIPESIFKQIEELKQRVHDAEKIIEIIKTLCSQRPMTSNEIAHVFNKREDYMRRKYLGPMIETGELLYLYSEMVNHPEQAYLTPKTN